MPERDGETCGKILSRMFTDLENVGVKKRKSGGISQQRKLNRRCRRYHIIIKKRNDNNHNNRSKERRSGVVFALGKGKQESGYEPWFFCGARETQNNSSVAPDNLGAKVSA